MILQLAVASAAAAAAVERCKVQESSVEAFNLMDFQRIFHLTNEPFAACHNNILYFQSIKMTCATNSQARVLARSATDFYALNLIL